MYLETICILSKKNSSVRSIDVSEYIGYSKPSVSRAVGILKKAAFLYKPYDTGKRRHNPYNRTMPPFQKILRCDRKPKVFGH